MVKITRWFVEIWGPKFKNENTQMEFENNTQNISFFWIIIFTRTIVFGARNFLDIPSLCYSALAHFSRWNSFGNFVFGKILWLNFTCSVTCNFTWKNNKDHAQNYWKPLLHICCWQAYTFLENIFSFFVVNCKTIGFKNLIPNNNTLYNYTALVTLRTCYTTQITSAHHNTACCSCKPLCARPATTFGGCWEERLFSPLLSLDFAIENHHRHHRSGQGLGRSSARHGAVGHTHSS